MMKCPRCDVELDIGIAIDAPNPNVRIFVGSPAIRNAHKALIYVFKCPKCGHSDDGIDHTKLAGIIDNR